MKKKKLNREDRALMPAEAGLVHDIAMNYQEKKHKNAVKYKRKIKHKRKYYYD